jgi:solute carrier family 8 (sodium/calcium exchanger)
MDEQQPSWGRLFKKAIMLGPQIEDNIEIESVDMKMAIMHFLTIMWNVLFAFVPPTHWGGGWPAFTVALTFIGLITMVVGDAAILFGCALGIP